jgi:hypothetical protein
MTLGTARTDEKKHNDKMMSALLIVASLPVPAASALAQ